MTRDPRVDDYIARAPLFAQATLTHARALVHRALPGAQECIKWGMPHFVVAGRNIVGLAAFKAHAAIVLHHESRGGKGMGAFGKIASLADLPPDDELIARFREGVAASGAAKSKRAPRPEPPVPQDLAAALAAAPGARATFAAFAPSHRREYVEWIANAQRAGTRRRRVAQGVEWIAAGRKRNWKYEDC